VGSRLSEGATRLGSTPATGRNLRANAHFKAMTVEEVEIEQAQFCSSLRRGKLNDMSDIARQNTEGWTEFRAKAQTQELLVNLWG